MDTLTAYTVAVRGWHHMDERQRHVPLQTNKKEASRTHPAPHHRLSANAARYEGEEEANRIKRERGTKHGL